jgi:hypothetical protein
MVESREKDGSRTGESNEVSAFGLDILSQNEEARFCIRDGRQNEKCAFMNVHASADGRGDRELIAFGII